MIIMFKIFSNISPATFLAEYFLKVLTFPSGLVAGWLLRIILDGTVLGDSFKEINLFIPLYVLFKSLSWFWKVRFFPFLRLINSCTVYI